MRSAGFPIQWLQELALTSNGDGAGHMDAGRPVNHAANGACYREVFAARIDEIRRRLTARFTDQLVQEAIYLSNRDAWQRVRALLGRSESDVMNSRARQRLRLAWSYLQRLCAKNDTHSFFGPISWGRFTDGDQGLVVHRDDGPWLSQRQVFVEHWAVQALADVISADADVRPFLPLRLNPGCRLEAGRLHYPLGRVIELPATAQQILERVANGRAATAWTAVTLRPESAGRPDYDSTFESLLAAGVIEQQIFVPTDVKQPIEFLLEAVNDLSAQCPARRSWRDRLMELTQFRDELAGLPLEDRVRRTEQMENSLAELLAERRERDKGRMYVGRYLCYEDCERNAHIELGKQVREDLRPVVSAVLDLYRWMSARVASLLHEHFLAVYRRLVGTERSSCDFLSFYHATTKQPPDNAEILATIRHELRQAWSPVLPEPPPPRLSVSVHDLAQVARSLLANTPADGLLAALGCDFHSVDFSIAAGSPAAVRRGDYQIVLSETHPAVFLVAQPVAWPFCPARESITSEVERLLAPAAMVLVDPPQGHNRSFIHWPNTELRYDVIPPGCSSSQPESRRIPAGRGIVREQNGRLQFQDVHSQQVDDLLTVMPGAYHRLLFELARGALCDCPSEIVCGRVVLQRRRWTIDGTKLPKVSRPAEEPEEFAQLKRWAAELGLPRWLFARTKDEPKPIYVDLENPLAVDLLYRHACKDEATVLSEMKPSPQDTWLADERGSYTCEFRTSWYRTSSHETSASGKPA